jgi:tRNA dimethylallyltransferase
LAQLGPPRFQCTWLGLALEREALYDQINRRVELMFERGLVEETQRVLEHFPACRQKLMKTIGYREVLQFLNDHWTKEQAMEEIQKNSRHYAKRQLSWFRSEHRIHWLEASALQSAIEFVNKGLDS